MNVQEAPQDQILFIKLTIKRSVLHALQNTNPHPPKEFSYLSNLTLLFWRKKKKIEWKYLFFPMGFPGKQKLYGTYHHWT